MFRLLNLTTPVAMGQYPDQVTISDLRIASVSVNFSKSYAAAGKALVSICLEDPVSGLQFADVVVQDSTQLGRMQAIASAAILPLSPPAAPSLSAVAGGALAAATYYAKITYTTGLGETLPSAEQSLAVAADNLLQVASPPAAPPATGYHIYAGTAPGTEQKQSASPIALGTAWMLPASGLVAGASVPASDSTSSQGGSIEDILLAIAIAATDPASGKTLLPPGTVVSGT